MKRNAFKPTHMHSKTKAKCMVVSNIGGVMLLRFPGGVYEQVSTHTWNSLYVPVEPKAARIDHAKLIRRISYDATHISRTSSSRRVRVVDSGRQVDSVSNEYYKSVAMTVYRSLNGHEKYRMYMMPTSVFNERYKKV